MQIRFSDEELARLQAGIRSMTRDSRLYKMLRDELSIRGNWKQMRRGKPGLSAYGAFLGSRTSAAKSKSSAANLAKGRDVLRKKYGIGA